MVKKCLLDSLSVLFFQVDVLRRLEDRHFESLQSYFREALDEWSRRASHGA